MPKSDMRGVYLQGQAHNTLPVINIDPMDATARVQRGDARWIKNGWCIQMLKAVAPGKDNLYNDVETSVRETPTSITADDMQAFVGLVPSRQRIKAAQRKINNWGLASIHNRAITIVPRTEARA